MVLMSLRRPWPFVVAAVAIALSSPLASAQQPGQLTVGPAVGEMAPDFEFQALTRYGAVKERVKLSDLHGQAVVLAFFPKARTKG
jgi:hypothetical protein